MTPLFNLGHEQFRKLFWDGRVQVDPSLPQGFATPAGADLPFGFEFALDALSIFAETDLQEMTGQPGTNELADASLIHPQIGVWDGLVLRLAAIPEYVDLFTAAFPEGAYGLRSRRRAKNRAYASAEWLAACGDQSGQAADRLDVANGMK